MFAVAAVLGHLGFAGGKRLKFAAFAGLATLLLASNAHAAFSSAASVSSNLNPSTAGDNVTFTATVVSTAYDIRQPIGFSAGTNQSLYLRYDFANASFGSPVTAAMLNDVTTPANFASVVVAQGGSVGDTYVVFAVASGASGIPFTDMVSLVVSGATLSGTPAVTYEVHGSALSASGNPANNSALVYSAGPTALSGYLTSVTPTGTFLFRLDGLAIAGCAAVPLVAGSAQCSLAIGTGGNKVVTVLYSGDANYAGSTGTLAGGQAVRLALTAASVPDAIYLTPFSFSFTAGGTTGAVTFTAIDPLPAGLSLSSAGVLSGTPTVVGSSVFRIAVSDASGAAGLKQYTQVIDPSAQAINFALAPNIPAATLVSLNGTASSGLPLTYIANTPLTCTIAGGRLRLLAPGSCTVTATQLGNVYYFAAAAVVASAQVVPALGTHVLRVRSSAAQTMKGTLANNQIQFAADNDPGPSFRMLGAVDFDGNGVVDLLYQNITQGAAGDVRLWKDFLPVNDQLVRSVQLTWDVQALGDLDGDGYGDIVWRYMAPDTPDTGVSFVWFSGGNGVAEVRKRGGAPLSWTLLGARDVDGDGAADMVYLDPNGPIHVLTGFAGRYCANYAAGSIPVGYNALHLADYTGNLRADILARNATTGQVLIVSLSSTALVFPPLPNPPAAPNASCVPITANVTQTIYNTLPNVPANWTYYASVDFNGDGISDIVWLLPDGSLTLWLMAANGIPTVVPNAGVAPVGFSVLQP